MERRKFQQNPWLKQEHKLFSREIVRIVYTNKKWRRVTSTDDLDGPDGLHCYYQNLRKQQQRLSRRPMEDSGVTICEGYSGKMKI